MDKIKVLALTKPVEWENTHIKAHEEIINTISQFQNHLNNIIDNINKLISEYEDVNNRLTTHISHILELNKTDKDILEELNSINARIDKLENTDHTKKYIVQKYEWILDTDTEVCIDLDPIELGWTYLVNIVVNEVIPNKWTMTYSFWNTSIAAEKYTPHVYLMAKEWEHAVLEYDFTVILTEL